MRTAVDLLSQFTGTGGGVKHALVNFGVAAIFWALLMAMARLAPDRHRDPTTRLLIIGSAIALSRELFMVFVRVLEAYAIFTPAQLHVVFPPLEHALSNIGLTIVAGVFAARLTGDVERWRSFALRGSAAVVAVYLVAGPWWAFFSRSNPDIRFGQTWTDWAFRIVTSVLLATAALAIVRGSKSKTRNIVVIALGLLFANEFLKIIDMAFGERYEAPFAVIRHSAYLAALPLLAFAYMKDQAVHLSELLDNLEDRVKVRTADLEAANEKLQTLSTVDSLTGVANRALFDSTLVAAWENASRSETELGIILIDVDDFKKINDEHGHPVGDSALKTVAELLVSSVKRPNDLVARIGGDEFAVILPGADINAIAEFAENIRTAVSDDGSSAMSLTVSIGFASSNPSPLGDPDELVKEADQAMYSAKEAGRNRALGFDDALQAVVATGRERRQLVRSALDNEDLVMHFQPVYDITTGDVIGAEALARLTGDDGSVSEPSLFLDAIVSTQQVVDLDIAGFNLACGAVAALAAEGIELPIACNLAPNTLRQPELTNLLGIIARRHNVDPTLLPIELTEDAVFSGRGDSAFDTIRELSTMGFPVVLDNFGAGFSALGHLRDLPVDVVKIDRSVTSQIVSSLATRSVALAITQLATDLEVHVVAEGVESVEQLEAVEKVGIRRAQGWHFSPAVTLEELALLVTAQATPDPVS